MARPPYQPTSEQRAQVQALILVGTPHREIAKIVGMNFRTLRKCFGRELDMAKQTALASVAASLYKKALGNGPQSVAAAIFYLKTQGGWREKSHIEVDATLKQLDLSKLTDDELDTLEQLTLKATPPSLITYDPPQAPQRFNTERWR